MVPAYTYTSSAAAAIHVGATVKFVDCQGYRLTMKSNTVHFLKGLGCFLAVDRICINEFMLYTDPDIPYHLVQIFDHMEQVDTDLCGWETITGHADKASGHIHTAEFHPLSDMERDRLEVADKRCLISARQDIDDSSGTAISQDTVKFFNVPPFGFRIISAGLAAEFINTERLWQNSRFFYPDGIHDRHDNAFGDTIVQRDVPDG